MRKKGYPDLQGPSEGSRIALSICKKPQIAKAMLFYEVIKDNVWPRR
jgi:hypothetical protein